MKNAVLKSMDNEPVLVRNFKNISSDLPLEGPEALLSLSCRECLRAPE